MKFLKTLVFALSLFSFSTLYSQSHLRFDNIQIQGSITEFSKLLISKGYFLVKKELNYMQLVGNYDNQPVKLYLYPTAKTQQIWKVVVLFKSIDNFEKIKNNYQSVKSDMELKYGKGKETIVFLQPYKQYKSNEKEAMMADKLRYFTFWKNSSGNVLLEIRKSLELMISFEDATNLKLKQSEEY